MCACRSVLCSFCVLPESWPRKAVPREAKRSPGSSQLVGIIKVLWVMRHWCIVVGFVSVDSWRDVVKARFNVRRYVSQISDVSHTAVKSWPLKHSVDNLGGRNVRRTSSSLVCLPSSNFWLEMAFLCRLIPSFSWSLQSCIDQIWLVRKAFNGGSWSIDIVGIGIMTVWHTFLSLFCWVLATFSLDEGLGA